MSITQPSAENHNVQLSLDLGSVVYSGLIPCQTFEFFLDGQKTEVDTLMRANNSFFIKNHRYSFTLNVYMVGDVTAEKLIEIHEKNVEFSLSLTKYRGGTWTIQNLGWNRAMLTGIRGQGMSSENLQVLNCTAKALEVVYKGKTYGHHLDGSG